jgi:hypothetical protein
MNASWPPGTREGGSRDRAGQGVAREGIPLADHDPDGAVIRSSGDRSSIAVSTRR